jgi:hypothetical protein
MRNKSYGEIRRNQQQNEAIYTKNKQLTCKA